LTVCGRLTFDVESVSANLTNPSFSCPGDGLDEVVLAPHLSGKVMGIACLIELTFLNGREKLAGYDFFSLIRY
jgi:hypothetical protein